MKKKKSLVLLAVGLVSGSISAWADDISLGQPVYGGTGCPQGSASAVLSDDGKSLSLLFDRYTVEAGGATGRRLDRKACNLAIPLHIPQGLSVSVVQVDYRGFVEVPYGGNAVFSAEYFFAGSKGPVASRTFGGPQIGDFQLTNQLTVGSIVWSPCGQDVILRSNASMRVQTNAQSDQAQASVDSADITAGILYQLQFRSCN